MTPTRSGASQRESFGFLRALFAGDVRSELLLPYPARSVDERDATAQMLDAVRDFAASHVDARAIDRDARIPRDTLERMKELGLFGMLVPAEFGGLGLSHTTYCRVLETLSGVCTASAATIGAHQSIGFKALLLFGNDEQKRAWLPKLASGEWIAAFALTEPGAGSDVQAIATTADPAPGGWRLRGSKLWITNGGIADVFTVFAKTPDPERPGERKISCFFVPRSTPGVSVGREEDKMGLKGSSTTAVFFEDAVVSDFHRIGDAGRGFKIGVEVLNGGRHGLSAGCLGLGRAALAEAAAHAKTRVQFGKPILEFPLVAELLANAAADLYAIESACYWVAGRLDEGAADVSLESAACKIFATESLWRIVNDCLQVTGGAGFMREYAHERRVRDARVNLIFEGTNQILRLFLALQGLRGPGDELKALGDALKHPLTRASVLRRVAGDRVRRSVNRPRTRGLPRALAADGMFAAECARRLAAASEALVIRYKKKVVDEQLALAALADAATHLFMAFTVLSHAAAEPSAARAPVVRLALRRLYDGFHRGLERIDTADAKLFRETVESL